MTVSVRVRRFPSGVLDKYERVPGDLHGRLYKSTEQRIAARPSSDLWPSSRIKHCF